MRELGYGVYIALEKLWSRLELAAMFQATLCLAFNACNQLYKRLNQCLGGFLAKAYN